MNCDAEELSLVSKKLESTNNFQTLCLSPTTDSVCSIKFSIECSQPVVKHSVETLSILFFASESFWCVSFRNSY